MLKRSDSLNKSLQPDLQPGVHEDTKPSLCQLAGFRIIDGFAEVPPSKLKSWQKHGRILRSMQVIPVGQQRLMRRLL